ncbi:hypothetical protein ABEB36_001692 [Hypothenemus hampei]|uniref:Suppressor of cytokine signaling 7 n=1 Tax=Hypothenemus hampei TaxID=57062 RepID=A0ABD1FFF2_HYPHA
MESPPSSSSWSHPFIVSDDSGLLLCTDSISSGNTSFESKSERRQFIFEDSDCEEKSLSQDDSLDGMSDIICGQNFNTLKKGPHWSEIKRSISPIEPPLEFQDSPSFSCSSRAIDFFCERLTQQILKKVMLDFRDQYFGRHFRRSSPRNVECESRISPPPLPSRALNQAKPPIRPLPEFPHGFHRTTPPYRSINHLPSPYRTYHHSYSSPISNFVPRPSSRSSLGGSSRLSSSHNSLCVASTRRVDDSSFITQAVSHDTLSSNQISDLYNVPFDSDIYAVPLDVLKTGGEVKSKKGAAYSCQMLNCGGAANSKGRKSRCGRKNVSKNEQRQWSLKANTKRHSVAGTSSSAEPIHMTLQEVRTYLQTLYSSSSDSSESKEKKDGNSLFVCHNNNNIVHKYQSKGARINQIISRPKKSTTFLINIKNKKVKDSSCDDSHRRHLTISPVKKDPKKRKIFSFKQTLCNIFRFRRFLSLDDKATRDTTNNSQFNESNDEDMKTSLSARALPPLPKKENEKDDGKALDFATSIQRVKDYGWYWGPLSSEAAEKILSNEPDGSFIVRDSSDDHYIFSLTFKLNNSVRHVRIEHFQGNFSFGSCTKFKSQTIVEFIENAVEHSRSGRYLFFLHRRPVIGPVRVQLLHPISRFKQVQSLQHMCRFVIHKNVRRDLIEALPLPRRMIDYLNTPHYYSERFINEDRNEEIVENVDSIANDEYIV